MPQNTISVYQQIFAFALFSLNKSNRVRTTDAFWLTARVLVFELPLKWHTFLFLMQFCSNSAHFSEIKLVCDGRTDGRTDIHTLL